MSDKGEWIDEWEAADEPCKQCDGLMAYRLFRFNDGTERYLWKCQDCGDSWWVDG